MDVLGMKQFLDGERIITQVRHHLMKSLTHFYRAVSMVTVFPPPLPPQGDKAECFFIVESGEVKIMMKSKVSDVPVTALVELIYATRS